MSSVPRGIINHMRKLFCAVAKSMFWANSTKVAGEYRCCKCGQLHRGFSDVES